MTYYVMCRVSGGVTGTRTALAKADGKVKTFPTFEAAADEADRLLKLYNNSYSKAHFEYWPVDENVAKEMM